MKNKNLWLVLLLVMLVSLLWGCSMSASSEKMELPPATMGEANKDSALGAGNSASTTVLPESRKLIRRINMEAQTKDMDALLPNIELQISSLGGYLESREIYNSSNASSQWRTAHLTIRIPADKADLLLAEIESAANILSLSETLTDVTLDYVATESRVKALQAEQERLLELMAQAKNLTELLEVEARLTNVLAELETVTSQLRVYDNMIDYTTIRLTVRQVTELTTPEDEMTVWQRISTGFTSNLNGLGETLVDIFVWLIVTSPILVVLAIPVTVVVLLIRSNKKKKNRNSARNENAQ